MLRSLRVFRIRSIDITKEYEKTYSDALSASLSHMSNLIELHIRATNEDDNATLVLDSVRLPTTLEQLCLQGDTLLRYDSNWQPPRLTSLRALSNYAESSPVSSTLVPQVYVNIFFGCVLAC